MQVNILPVTSVRNPRDLGGYVTKKGQKIKSRRLLRTGNISRLTDEDEKFLLNYGLNKIIDLRSSQECATCPDREIESVKHYNLPFSNRDNTNGGGYEEANFENYRKNQYAGFKMMCQRYHDHVLNPFAQANIQKILELLANSEEGAILYHCSEGKDRTGLVTLFILSILGVDLETIRQDYLFSNYMLNDYRAKRDVQFEKAGENLNFRANMRILGSVSDAFFDTALITIKQEYGDMDNYLREALGVSSSLKADLKELYLEKN